MITTYDEKTKTIHCYSEPKPKTHIAISNIDVMNQIRLACLKGECEDGFRVERRNPSVIQLTPELPACKIGEVFLMNDSKFKLLGKSDKQLLVVNVDGEL